MCSRDPSSGGTSRARSAQAKEYVARIRRHAIQVDDPPEASGLTRDPADDYLVSLGRQGNVDAIISLDLRPCLRPAWRIRRLGQFRRVIGYTDLSKLVIAIERRHLTLESPNPARHTDEVTTDTVTTESAAQLAIV